MEQDNDLKYFVGLENVQHLLAVYGIEDCEPSGANPYLLATTEPHTLSKIINVGFASVLRTHNLVYSEEAIKEHEELCEMIQLHDFLKSCLGKDVEMKEKVEKQKTGQTKIFPHKMLLKSTLLQGRILSLLEEILSERDDAEIYLAKNFNIKEPLWTEQMGYYAWHIINNVFCGFDFVGDDDMTKTKIYSFIYDIFLEADLVINDYCNNREKSERIRYYLSRYNSYINH